MTGELRQPGGFCFENLLPIRWVCQRSSARICHRRIVLELDICQCNAYSNCKLVAVVEFDLSEEWGIRHSTTRLTSTIWVLMLFPSMHLHSNHATMN